jgi:hypothetical protein
VLSAAAAAVGAGVGAHFALRRYRTERRFDRIIKWHEDVVLAFQRMQRHLELIVAILSDGADMQRASRATEPFYEFLPEFERICGQRVLYSISAKEQLQVASVESEVATLAQAWRSGKAAPADFDLLVTGEALWSAANEVGLALRTELGMKQHYWEGRYREERDARRFSPQ